MKRVFLFSACLIISLCVFTSSAYATESIHISKEISNKVKIDADIAIPGREEYSTYKLLYPDLTISDTLNENALADLFFVNQSAARIHNDDRDTEPGGRWGLNSIENAAGEFVSAGQTGIVIYSNSPLEQRYSEAVFYIQNGISGFLGFWMNTNFTLEELSKDHDYMTLAQADDLGKEVVGKVFSPLAPARKLGLSIDHEQLKSVYNEFQSRPDYPLIPVDDWNETDDLYVMQYNFYLDGLSIPDVAMRSGGYRGFRTATVGEPLNALVYINRDGVCYANMSVGTLGEAMETKPVISYEEALQKLEGYLSELIPPVSIIITDGALRYIPIPKGQDIMDCVLTPVWCFSSDEIYEDGERGWGVTYGINAFTGEELT